MSPFERVLLALIFLVYCALVIAGAFHHEPWWDEAQAWLIARDTPLVELFTRGVRYEGHPPLWYLLLAIPAKLGLPYWWLKVIGVLGGAATAFLLLFAFPRVPIYIRIVAPFAFFIAYQYTVVSRSYVLLGPLLLLIAWMYERRAERPGLFALLLILMSNVSVHGFAIACGLAFLFLLEAVRGGTWRQRGFVIGASAFVLHAILLVLVLWPPKDNPSYVHHYSMLDPARHTQVMTSIIAPLYWPPAGDESPWVAVGMVAAALLALTVLVWWFFRSGAGWAFTLGTLGSYVVALRYFSQWHEGIFFFLLLFGAVLAFQRGGAPRWLSIAAQVCLVLLLLRHAQWTFQSIAYDLRHEFTGSRETAEFLRKHRLDERVMYATGSPHVELQPYFAANVFDNYDVNGRAYWEWSSKNWWPYPAFDEKSKQQMTRFIERVLDEEPEVIVYSEGILEDELYLPRLLRDPRYRRVARFTGMSFWKNDTNWELDYQVFVRVRRRSDTRPASAPRSDAR